MKILTQWLREYLPGIPVDDDQLAEDLTLRGIAVEGVFEAGEGSVFEMDITTNRVDAMNHYGIAREAAAIYGLGLAPVGATMPTAETTHGSEARYGAPRSSAATEAISVQIDEPSLCGRFTARVLRGVTIRPSSGVVVERFAQLGQKLISNAVDATNFVTLAIGQPTHAFDLDKIVGGLVVRRARKGEKLRTLDSVERALDPDDLIIADEAKPLAIAGVMGGWDTMITAQTRNIVVEAGWFDPATVRRGSRRHGLHTDASHRFERGADFNAAPLANALVSRIILEAGGEQYGGFIDVIVPEVEVRTAKRPSILLQVSEVCRILGATEDAEGITAATVESVLSALGCTLAQRGYQEYTVTLPSWRLDLEREIDLIEEVARVYGYNRFANTLPPFAGTVVELPWAKKESTVRRTLLALGWTEAISSTFCAAAEAELFAPQPRSAVAIGNPLSEEAGMLRPSLVPGMLAMLQGNLNRDVEDVALFEMGTVFSGNTEKVDERPALSLGVSGHTAQKGPHQSPRVVDFYDVKGAVEELLGRFSSLSLYFDAFSGDAGLMPTWLHPGRSARVVVDGMTVGYFGQLHPAEAQHRKLRTAVFVGELYLDRLYRQALRQPLVHELSRFQAVRRDFSFLVEQGVRWSTIEAALNGLAIAEMASFGPREVLREGKEVPSGSYSLLLSAVFQSADRTLREEELQDYSQRIVAALQALGGRLRSSAAVADVPAPAPVAG